MCIKIRVFEEKFGIFEVKVLGGFGDGEVVRVNFEVLKGIRGWLRGCFVCFWVFLG